MLRVIREIAPKYIVGENVLGLVNWNGGMVFDEVHADLEAEGYEVATVVIPAAAKNAPHGRDRVWFVAYNISARLERGERTEKSCFDRNGVLGDRLTRGNLWGATPNTCNEWLTADPDSDGQHERNGCDEVHASQGREYALGDFGAGDDDGNVTNADKIRLSSTQQIRKLERRRLSKHYIRTTWSEFPTQSPICGGNDGLPSQLDGITFPKWRNESIKAYGNAIVPQVAFEIFKAIQSIETQP